jgi:serine/threonine protein kinase
MLLTTTHETHTKQGTVRYMAPEVVHSHPYNEKVDVYSFGLLVWEMLAYRRVFEGIGAREFYQQARYNLFLHLILSLLDCKHDSYVYTWRLIQHYCYVYIV